MRAWQIIVGSSGATTAFCAVFLSVEFSWRAADWPWGTEWPLLAVAWPTLYGLAVLTMTTVAFWADIGQAWRNASAALIEGRDPATSFGVFKSRETLQPLAQIRQIKRHWMQWYFIRLGTSQFFTAIVVLLGLGVARIDTMYVGPVAGFLSAILGHWPAFIMAALLGTAGLVGSALAAMSTLWLARRASQLFLINAGIGLLRQMSDRLSAPPGGVSVNSQTELAKSVENGQRVVLSAIKDLAISLNRLVRRTDAEATLLLTSEKLVATADALDASLAKLNEWTASVPAVAPLPGQSQLSLELHDLLREIDSPPVNSGAAEPEI